MNRPAPHIGCTLAQRQALRYAEIDRPAILSRLHAQNAALANEQAREEAAQLAAQARRERERADELHAALEVDALINRVRLSPQFVADVAEPADKPLLVDLAKFAAALIVMAGVAVILREPVARLLVVLGLWS